MILHVSVHLANVCLEDKHIAGSQLPCEQRWGVTKVFKDGFVDVLELISYFQEDVL